MLKLPNIPTFSALGTSKVKDLKSATKHTNTKNLHTKNWNNMISLLHLSNSFGSNNTYTASFKCYFQSYTLLIKALQVVVPILISLNFRSCYSRSGILGIKSTTLVIGF